MKTFLREMVISEVLHSLEAGAILEVADAVERLRSSSAGQEVPEEEIEEAVFKEAVARGAAMYLDGSDHGR